MIPRRITPYANLTRARAARHHTYYPLEFHSDFHADNYSCLALDGSREASPSTACAFSTGAKRGVDSALAIGTNEGLLCVIQNSRKVRVSSIAVYQPPSIPQGTAIFDITWRTGDDRLAAVAGSGNACIVDARTGSELAVLLGHTATVKAAQWSTSDPNLLASGGRDGAICIWDVRTESLGNMRPITIIRDAHRRPGAGETVTTVTALSFPSSIRIHSTSCSDSRIREWDLRRATGQVIDCSAFSESKLIPSQMAIRSRGLVGLGDIGNGLLIAAARDSKIYTFEETTLNPTGVVYHHRNLNTNSPYSSLEMSPCKRWVAAGGYHGQVVAFNVEKSGYFQDEQLRPEAQVLHALHGEVNSLSWSHSDIATASDDGSVKLWRSLQNRYSFSC